jgi:hypothetical protein
VPAVGFEHLLAWTPGTDAAPKPGQHAAESFEPREDIAKLGELYLDFRFRASGPAGENVEYYLRTAHHPALEDRFQVADLRRFYGILIENDQAYVLFGDKRRNPFNLPFAYQMSGVERLAFHNQALDDHRARRVHKHRKLVEGLYDKVLIVTVEVNRHKKGPFVS